MVDHCKGDKRPDPPLSCFPWGRRSGGASKCYVSSGVKGSDELWPWDEELAGEPVALNLSAAADSEICEGVRHGPDCAADGRSKTTLNL